MTITPTTEQPANPSLSRDDIVRVVHAWRRGTRIRFRRYTRKNNEPCTRVEVIVDYEVERTIGDLEDVSKMSEGELRAALAAKFATRTK